MNSPVTAAPPYTDARRPPRRSDNMLPLMPFFMMVPAVLFFTVSQELAVGGIALLLLSLLVGPTPLLMTAIFALTPFPQGLGGEGAVNVSAADCVALLLVLSLPLIWLRQGRLVAGPAAVPLLFYLGIAVISSVTSWEGLGTAVSLARTVMETAIAVLIFANADTRLSVMHRCFKYYLLATNVLTGFVLLTFLSGGYQASMYTLGINKNALGPIFGCGILIALVYLLTQQQSGERRLWLLLTLITSTIGIVLSFSRGAWIATAASYLVVLLLTRNTKAFIISLIVLIPTVAIVWSVLPQEATDQATDISVSSWNIKTRFEAIDTTLTAFRSSPVVGVGIGLRKRVEPHNVLILTLGETGILGLVGFLGMFAGGFYTFYLALKSARGNLPATQIVLIGTSLFLVSLLHGMMDVYWRRGVGFAGWSCVGMAVNILNLGRKGYLAAQSDQSVW